MDARYSRNCPALSKEECGLLRRKRVLVVGCGGLGGYLTEMLARIGVKSLRVADGDVFEPTNLNRQLLSEMPLLGTGKAAAAADRIRRINPDIAVEAVDSFMTENNVHALVDSCDVVLDGLDSIESRRILAKECDKQGVPFVYGAINRWVAQAAVSMPGDHLIDLLFSEGTSLKDNSVLSFTPALCASMQVSLCVKLLTGRPVKTGTVYYFDLLNQEYEEIPMI